MSIYLGGGLSTFLGRTISDTFDIVSCAINYPNVTNSEIFNVTIFIIVYYFELNTYIVPQYVFELFIYVEGRLGLREFNHYVILITFNVTIFPERIMLIMIYLI